MPKISVVVNTYKEEKNIQRCLASVKDFAGEIVVVDMHSDDKTVEIAKKYNARVFYHDYTRYVEPARNFAITKAKGDYIFIIDADEELSSTLASELTRIAREGKVDYVEIPRKNIIFGKWIENSRWWPDYLIRFFKKNKVKYSTEIHVPPKAEGTALKLEARGEFAIVHHNFQSVFQYIERLNRYTDIQSEEIFKKTEVFDWKDLVFKPANEFFSRFFAAEGYKDGLHGLVLALLQAFSEFILYLKVWEKKGFKEEKINEFNKVSIKIIKDYFYWLERTTKNSLEKLRLKIKAKI
ncbi:glycosyltransferase family 2 protein [Candidatus Microgenomates bacterium]|jgi:(heptosyl)LPS beta-1,4-glucosyltransferase|nr:MAG: glycosyltransferase family 2 protein [Candidatus Microgenomates bacterium]